MHYASIIYPSAGHQAMNDTIKIPQPEGVHPSSIQILFSFFFCDGAYGD